MITARHPDGRAICRVLRAPSARNMAWGLTRAQAETLLTLTRGADHEVVWVGYQHHYRTSMGSPLCTGWDLLLDIGNRKIKVTKSGLVSERTA